MRCWMKAHIILLLTVVIACNSSSSPTAPDEDTGTAPEDTTATAPEDTTATAPEDTTATAPEEPFEPSPDQFNIQLAFVPGHGMTAAQMGSVRAAARRWESIITGDIPDYDGFESSPFDSETEVFWQTARQGKVVIDDVVDDVVVLVTTDPTPNVYLASATLIGYRSGSGFPVTSIIVVGDFVLAHASENELTNIFLHEMAHAIGFGTTWGDLEVNPTPGDPDADIHFTGPLALAAFNAAGGSGYTGNKVPVTDGGHWRGSVFGQEVMSSDLDTERPAPLSAITIQSMADLGYEVDVTKADDYTLPISN